jgi:hypothetical protein
MRSHEICLCKPLIPIDLGEGGMVPYHQDPKHVAPLHEAPRCQHTRLNGQRCGSPALRGESHCHFHNRIQDRALAAEDREPFLPFVEDATSLQFASCG